MKTDSPLNWKLEINKRKELHCVVLEPFKTRSTNKAEVDIVKTN